MTTETQFSLPVPYIYDDGTVAEISINKWENHDFISIRDENQSILVSSPDHARQIARALMIAADNWNRV